MKLDPAAAEFIRDQQQAQAQADAETEAKPERVTRLRPHEAKRKARQMNVTFQTPAWPNWLRKFAKERELRPGDLIVWCVSYAIDQIRNGQIDPPTGEGRKQHHRAGEWLDLPWRPEKEKENKE